MVKRVPLWLTTGLHILVTFEFLRRCAANDWSSGCFKEDLNNRYFNVSAGNYVLKKNSQNSSAGECVEACSSLNNGYKLAALTPGGVCLCSSALTSSLRKADSNTSCLYGSSDGLYFTVYQITPLANISIPGSVVIFQEFLVNISTVADHSCSYTLDFNDGRQVTVTTPNTSITHVYKNAGTFTLTLSSHALCLPEVITANIEVKTAFGNVSLDCPAVLEATDYDSYCTLLVQQGSMLNVTLNSEFLGTVSDTTVQSLGINSLQFYNGIMISPSFSKIGTYLLPLQPAVDNGVLAAIDVYLNRSGSFKIQIFSPNCPTNKIPCFGDCVAPDFPCGGPEVSECSEEQEMCVTLGQCNSTSSCEDETSFSRLNISFIDYVVRTEFTINIKSPGYSFHRLSSPVPMLRGDIIGWSLSSSSASLWFIDSISPSVLFYPNPEFTVGAKVVRMSLTENKLNRAYYFRAHFQTTSVFEIGLKPSMPRVDVNVNVSSLMWGSHKMLSRTVRVQDRIYGLHLVSETKYFPTMKDIYFAFKVTNGSDVRYFLDAGDGSELMHSTSGNFSHSFQHRGQYALNVTAINEINNVTLQENLTFVNDIGNLSFTRDPWDTPGERGIPYLVKFRLGAGDSATFVVEYDGNYTSFLTCDNLSDQELSANHSFPKVGIYNITVKAYNKHLNSSLVITSRVEIMERIDNLTLFEIKNGKDIPLGEELERRPYTWPLNIRARVSSGSSLTFRAIVQGTVKKDEKPTNTSSHEVEFKFEFTSSGVRAITIAVRNGISQTNRTVRVTLREDCDSWLSFVDKRNEGDPLRTTRDTELRFSLEEHLCNSSCSKYTWTLFMKDGSGRYKMKDVMNNTQSTSQDVLIVPKGTFKSGSYKLRVNTSCEERGEFNPLNVSETYFLIERRKPVALILGGKSRDVAYDEDAMLILHASSSYDPDERHFDSEGLVFEWICLLNCSLIFQTNSSKARVNMEHLVKGRCYEFQVTVNTSDDRSGVATQRICLVDKSIPTTEIKCIINCLPFVVTTERLSLEGFCPNCGNRSDFIFDWCLREEGNLSRCSRNDKDTFTTWTGSNIVIKPNVLEKNKTYQLLLKGRRDSSSHESLSVYEFKTSATGPTGGHCTIRPSSGYSVGTNFQVFCQDWSATYYPLTYSVRYQSSFLQNANVSSVSEDNQIWILWYHGQEQISPRSMLPSGPESKNYFLNVNVQIQDKYGAYTLFNMSVQVKKNQTDFTASLKRAVSKLENVDVKSHPQKFTQLVTTYSTILNEDSTTDISQSKKIRLDLVLQLSKVKADSLPLIKQTTDAVKLAIYESTEVTHKTQITAADTLKKMSRTLVDIASDPTRRNGQVIDETARNLFSGVSKILDSSFFTGVEITNTDASDEVKSNLYGTKSKKGSELEKIGKETQGVVSNVVFVIQDISFAMLKKKLIGEQPTITQTKNFDMKLENKLAQDVDKINRLSNGSGQFLLPQNEMLFSNENYSQVYTEFIAFKKNPFSWDIERSPFIQSRVLSLSFKTDKNVSIPVRDLSKDIEIFLFNEKQNIHRVLLESSNDDPKLLVYNFKVTQSVAMETVLLDFQRSNGSRLIPGAQFFIRFGKQVSRSNFDFSHQFTNCSTCEGHSIDIQKSTVLVREFKKLELNGGRVSVAVLPCSSREMSTQACNSSVEKFTVYVTSVSCRFWDKSGWRSEGCRVGPKTTPWRTHCLCNHLTSFGSYLVRPNPLTKFSLEDFKKGYVIFVAVAIVFLIYILIFVWARRTDRTASNKGGMCVLPDNNPEDRYRYEIAIWTGMRRNAGTESEVTIILSGDLQDSQPRRLVNPNTKGYERGSLEKFILTTPEDIGSLYCIRIYHDNSKGSWYLSRVMVTDFEREERYYFICDRWLAVDEDDGAIERLLPVASDEELTEFQRLFFSRTERNLSDSHLWISVWNRPPQSQFTRVQRLSCCLCLLMITMVTNAMFYNARSEPKENSTNFIGSYSFTWDELFIGVASSLIIFPVNIIILYIFRHVRQKPSKPRSSSFFILDRLSPNYNRIFGSPSVTSSTMTTVSTVWWPGEDEQISSVPDFKTNLPVVKKKKKKKKVEEVTFWSRFRKFLPKLPSSLPHWFVYIAWFFLVVLTLGSAAVLILYGMEFGNGRSLQWLFSTVVSICEDIFVLQPLKVLLLALLFALFVKKPDEGEFSISAADASRHDDKELLMASDSRTDLHQTRAHSPTLYVRPGVGQLKTMRKARLKERKMFGLIHEIIVHLLFSIVIALVAYGHKDSRAIFLFRNLDGLSADTEKIRNFSVFWNWSQTVLIPKAFPEKLYNLEDVPSYGFFDDGYNNLISRARMRLLRVKQDSCTIPSEFKGSIDFCTKDYSIFDQDEACYDERWTKTTCTSTDTPSPWSFQGWRDLDAYPYWGRFETYSGSGYITELTPGINNNETANEMKKLRWLDRYSRALAVELTVYNANVNLFSSILLLFEFPNFGGVFFRRDIRPMRLKVYVGGFAFFIFACEVVFLIFIAMYLYLAVKKIYHKRVAYFREFWNLIDFAIVAVSLAGIAVYIYRIDLITSLMQRVRSLDGKFVNFQYATYWNEVFDCIVATIVCLTTIKLTKLMRFNLRISLFSLTLKRARPAIMAFSLQFGIVFFAYVLLGVLVFGHNSSSFRSIPSTVLSLGCQILGKNQFTGVSEIESEPVVGPAFFFTFVLFVCWIYVNMFVGIIIDAYHQVQLDCGHMTNEYEVMEFFLARLRAWSGRGNTHSTAMPPSARWQRAGAKVKAVNKFGRHRRVYQPSNENVALEKTADVMERLENSVAKLEKRVDVLQTLYHMEQRGTFGGLLV